MVFIINIHVYICFLDLPAPPNGSFVFFADLYRTKMSLYSTNNSRQSVEEYNYYLFENYLLPVAVILTIYLVIGIIGNGFVIFIYQFRFKDNVKERYFIPHLAVVDMLSCVLNVCTCLPIDILPANYNNDAACAFMWFAGTCSATLSGLVLFVIAVQRYLKICRPHRFQMTLRWKRAALVLAIAISLLSSWPVVLFYKSNPVYLLDIYGNNVTGFHCTVTTEIESSTLLVVHKVILLVMAIIVFFALTILYSLIGKTVCKHIQSKKISIKSSKLRSKTPGNVPTGRSTDNAPEYLESTQGSNTTIHSSKDDTSESVFIVVKSADEQRNTKQKTNQRSATRYTMMFMIITIVFVISFIPKVIMMLYDSINVNFWSGLTPSQLAGYRFFSEVYIINNIFNPFIYGSFDTRFREEVSRMCCQSKIR